MRDHGYLVSKGEGGLLSDYHCHAVVVALQNTTYTFIHHSSIEEKTAEKSNNKSIWNWYINRGTKSVSMGEMCVTWHFLLGWVDDMNRSLDPYSVLLTSKWPLLPFDSGMLLYHNEWDRRLTLFVEKRHNVWKTFMMIPLLLLYFNWIYKNAILRGCRWSIVELVLEESESLKKERKKNT